jgi:hypothetical protein
MVAAVTIETDTRDRLIKVEVKVEHIDEKLDKISAMVEQQHDVFMQAKGAKWVIWTAAGIVGFVGGVMAWAIPWLYGSR